MNEWRQLDADAKQTLHGMTPVGNAKHLATTCAGCHVGAPPDARHPIARDVNHDMIAAGHPRLMFEFSSYFANLPEHWKAKPNDDSSRWAVGQVASAETALELLRFRAAFKDAVWPEFAEYDCFGCHHGLAEPSWRQTQKSARLGAPAWGTWYFALPKKLAEKTPALAELETAMNKTRPRRDEVVKRTEEALLELNGFHATIAAWPKGVIRQKVATILNAKDRASWDAAEQMYLALFALSEPGADPQLSKQLNDLLHERAFAATMSGPSSVAETSFNPITFLEKLRAPSRK
jgi:hypothetical protein